MSSPLPALRPLLLGAVLALGSLPSKAQEPPRADADAGGTPEAQDPPVRPSGGAAPSDDAFKMGSPPSLAEGTAEEEMWPAATAEGWKQPCLVRWQRTFEDALAVARTENRPLLVAVNMDGEIASEHFAGVRYRDPDTAELMSHYACVIASVYRHTPRDYDEDGRRVECPRFGTVTCGEHIDAERELYERYFDGKRVAPRHIVLDLEEKETLDVYYAWDTATIFTTFRKGVEGWPEPNDDPEPTLTNLVQSADVADRELVERMYAEGDRERKSAILHLLIEQEHVVDEVEVLRSAILGFDVELASLGRRALARCDTEDALDLMAEALKTPLEDPERELLLAAVGRMAESSKRARTLAALHSGLTRSSRHIDPATLEARAREYEANARAGVDVATRAEAALARPQEPGALLELAEALLARAQEPGERRYAKLLLEDARSAADQAEGLGAGGPRLDAVVAVVSAELGERGRARARAVAAVEGGILQAADGTPAPGDAPTLTDASKARLLQLFAEARRRSIREAYRAGDEWPPEWLSDVNAAFESLAESAYVDARTLVDFHDFLRWIGATPRAVTVLDEALERFPDEALLHERLRARLLWEGGPEGLERGYAERLARERGSETEPTQLTWYAGYASLVAAEHHRRRSEFDEALASYERAVGLYRRNLELFPDGRDSCEHFIAMAWAGRARVALEQGDLGAATDALLTSLEQRPDSAATQDGLGLTAVATAKMLKARLAGAGDGERETAVQAALDALDPALFEPPPSELPGGRRAGR